MIRSIWREWHGMFINWKRFKLLAEFKRNNVSLREGYTEAFYRVWESGYVSGQLNKEPEKAWNEMERVLGVHYPISDRLKKIWKGGKDGKIEESREKRVT